MRSSRMYCTLLALLLFASMQPAAPHAAVVANGSAYDSNSASAAALAKIDPRLVSAVANGRTARFLLIFAEQADVSDGQAPQSEETASTFYDALHEVADRTQPAVRAALDQMGLSYKPFYIVNMILIESGTRPQMERLAARPEIKRLVPDETIQLAKTQPAPAAVTPLAPSSGTPWNIDWIHAPDAWAKGFRGQGIIYASLDTGVDWTHPALQNQYRGWNGVSADHNYNWWDAVAPSSGRGACPSPSPFPCDENGQGTHTMGTVLGYDPVMDLRIGVAPEAKWIACRASRGVSPPLARIIGCLQWFMAPTDLDGQNPDASKRPHVVGISWANPAIYPDALKTAFVNLHKVGVLTIMAAGNAGPRCGSIGYPAAWEETFAVGAMAFQTNTVAYFSARGPGREGLFIKPDIVAPGESILSSIPHARYARMSGTSMAMAHVAGSTLLLLSKEKSLIGNIKLIMEKMRANAFPIRVTANDGCGSIHDTPNYIYGWGMADNSKL